MPLRVVPLNVEKDYLESIIRSRNPIQAVSELVWNALDADANKVAIETIKNALGVIEEIRIIDDGTGISFAESEQAFGKLGGSWKVTSHSTKKFGRDLHGNGGKGRFKALALGRRARWETRYSENGQTKEFSILIRAEDLCNVEIEDRAKSSNDFGTGTILTISAIKDDLPSILAENVADRLAEEFALYLIKYPNVKITFDGMSVDPNSVIDRKDELKGVEIQLPTTQKISLGISVIEWKSRQGRSILLCGLSGIPIREAHIQTHTPGFTDYTAYFRSEFFQELQREGLLVFSEDDIHPGLKKVISEGKKSVREHFRNRASGEASLMVERWKAQDVYPYRGEPSDPVDQVERQVFDIAALQIHTYLDEFEESSKETKKLTLGLLKLAVQKNPGSLQLILSQVLHLPEDEQDNFADLLRKTTLTAIITAAKVVAERLEFLSGLEEILYDPESKKATKERSQLHRILSKETWIFGEQFNLTVDDESLTSVLHKHLKLLGRNPDDDRPVTTADGSNAIIDLMLSRRIPQPEAERREHLVVELKRPSVKIDSDILGQIHKYAIAVSSDERFRDTKTRWEFWAVSNDVTTDARKLSNQGGRAEGLSYVDEEEHIRVWVKSWGQIIESCRARLKFFQEKLEYEANHEGGIEYLRKKHAEFLPEVLKKSSPK